VASNQLKNRPRCLARQAARMLDFSVIHKSAGHDRATEGTDWSGPRQRA